MATTIGKLRAILSLDSTGFAKGLRKSSEQTSKFARQVERTNVTIQNLGRLPTMALRGVAAFGALELGLKGVDAVGEAINGEFEKAAELVKQLPAGLGPFAQGLEGVLGKLTGVSAEIQRINEAVAAQNDRILTQQKQVAAFKGLESFSMTITQQIDFESFATDEAREAYKLNLERLDALKRVRELAKQTGGVGGENALADAVAKVNKLYDMRAAKLNQVVNKTTLDINKLIAPYVEAFQKNQMDLKVFAAGIFESTRTPMEIYERQLDRLSDALNAGMLDWETYARGVAKAKAALEAASKVDMPESPGYRPTAAIERGSLEDHTLRIQAGLDKALNPNGQNSRDVKDTARSTKDSAKTLRSVDSTLDRMLHELNQQQRIQVVSIL